MVEEITLPSEKGTAHIMHDTLDKTPFIAYTNRNLELTILNFDDVEALMTLVIKYRMEHP